MRILIVGDQHFRFQLPYATALSDGRRGEWEAVLGRIHEVGETVDAVVLLGDNLNTRHNHSTVNKEFVEFIKGFGSKHVYVIAGNHERYGTETALDFLKSIEKPGLHVFTEPTTRPIVGGGEKVIVTFLPYMTPGSVKAQDLADAKSIVMDSLDGGDILFLHHTIGGSLFSDEASAEHLNEIVLSRDELEAKYEWIFGGHIHEPQALSTKTYVAGSIFTQEVGEKEKFVYVLDTKVKKLERIPLPVRGIYKVVNPTEEDMKVIPKHSIVKVVITDRGFSVPGFKESFKGYYDAMVVVEQYPSQRAKIDLEDSGALDLSLNNLLKVYSESKGVSHQDLLDALGILDVPNT